VYNIVLELEVIIWVAFWHYMKDFIVAVYGT
jgi:hypothetical protein